MKIEAASILGTGAYLPDRVLANADLERMVETTDEWITSRTGIRERRVAAPDETTSDMGTRAAAEAIANAGLRPEDIDVIITATTTPDTIFPATSCYLQHKIGARRAAAFDIQAACTGFLVGLMTAEGLLRAGRARHVLVVGAEKLSSIVNWEDRNTCVLFGDGAGAAVIGHREGGRGILACDVGCDGAQTDILILPAGGTRMPATAASLSEGKQYLHMAGKEVYRQAVTAMNRSAEKSMADAGISGADLAWVIPHQANLRIISAVAERLGVPMDRFVLNLERCGNTSAACIPMALHEASQDGRLRRGELLLLVAFGSGLTWASAILEW
jgi:3-oxoacyl-[acyl-carrier-protein] synthase-3